MCNNYLKLQSLSQTETHTKWDDLISYLKIWRRSRHGRRCVPIVETQIGVFGQKLLLAFKIRIAIFNLEAVSIVDVATDLLAFGVPVADEYYALRIVQTRNFCNTDNTISFTSTVQQQQRDNNNNKNKNRNNTQNTFKTRNWVRAEIDDNQKIAYRQFSVPHVLFPCCQR